MKKRKEWNWNLGVIKRVVGIKMQIILSGVNSPKCKDVENRSKNSNKVKL